MSTAIKTIAINGSTRQGTSIDYAVALNTHGNLAINTVEEIATYPDHEYRDPDTGEVTHNVVFVPIEHEQHTARLGTPVIGGWEIHHIGCDQCVAGARVGRMDSFIFAERVHLAAVQGADLPREVAK